MSELDKWNSKAKEQNTNAFIKAFNRQPKDYNEVLEWVNKLIENAKSQQDYKEVSLILIKVANGQEVYKIC